MHKVMKKNKKKRSLNILSTINKMLKVKIKPLFLRTEEFHSSIRTPALSVQGRSVFNHQFKSIIKININD